MNEIAQFLDDVICECLDNPYCVSCPYYEKNWGCCIFNVAPELWDSDKMIKIFER